MKRGPLTLLRRTWVVPVGHHDSDASWGSIPSATVIVERADDHGKELRVEVADRRVLALECDHPAFLPWITGLIDALSEAIREPCDVLSWTCEKMKETYSYKPWPTPPEIQNINYEIPAGATPVWFDLQTVEVQDIFEPHEMQAHFHGSPDLMRIFPGWTPPSK